MQRTMEGGSEVQFGLYVISGQSLAVSDKQGVAVVKREFYHNVVTALTQQSPAAV